MPSFFESLFNRKQLQVNVYNNTVQEPVTFKLLSLEKLEELYTTLPDVRIIEDWKADNIAKIPVGVFNSQDEEVFNTPLNQLIEQTNLQQSWSEYIKEVFILYGLTGNTFTYRNPDSGYLYTLLSSDVYVQLAADKTLPEYMNFVSGYLLKLGGRDFFLEAKDVLQVKTASLASEDGLWTLGSSPYNAGTPTIETLNATYSSRVSTIRDRGALGFISNDSQTPDPEQSQLTQEALGDYGITEGKGKFVVTTEQLRWQQMSLGIGELQLLENGKYDFNTLCKLNMLDPLIFTSEGSTYANQEQARKAAIVNSIIPRADKYYGKFNEWIKPYYGGLRILPKYDELPEIADVNKELSDKVIAEYKAGLLTHEQAFMMLYPDLEYVAQEIEEEAEETIIEDEEFN